MCGRLALTANIDDIKQHFAISPNSGALLVPRYNIAPSQLLLIVKDNKLEFVNWGIKLPQKNFGMVINAKIETVLEKKLFNNAFIKQRCLVIGSGFFEWKSVGGKKIPYYIQVKNNKILGFAGIMINNDCVILTTAAVSSEIHPRIPVIIKSSEYAAWLNTKTPVTSLMSAELHFSASDFFIHPVSSQVNNPKFDNIACVKPLNF